MKAPDVGRVWRKARSEEGSYSAQTEIDLIVLLVEERAKQYSTRSPVLACLDFDIDPNDMAVYLARLPRRRA